MRSFAAILSVLLVSACATLGVGRSDGDNDRSDAERRRVWEQAHDAFSRDSFRVAEALFQRLVNDFPRTHEAHEARFYLGVLNLEPRSRVSLPLAVEHLSIYLTEDSLRHLRGYHDREAESLLQLARLLNTPCGRRTPPIGCGTDTTVVTRTVEGASEGSGASPAEVARLRRQVGERDARIEELEAELRRIRNTLAPRTPRD